ncbi:hypothetical protein TNCV_3586391 [Trichonephila clavipes]|nr:hypothetical protein TNCV_3586391 [Trichonephila clavipes]
MTDKDILKFAQSSKNINDADSDEENEMNTAAPVPTSSETRMLKLVFTLYVLMSSFYLRITVFVRSTIHSLYVFSLTPKMDDIFLIVFRKKKPSLQEALDLLQNLPSESSDALTDDSSDEDDPANYQLEFSLNT